MKFKVPGQDIIVEIGADGCSVSNPAKAQSVESTQSMHEWYQVTQKLARLVPTIILIEDANKDGTLSNALAKKVEEWTNLISIALKTKKPVRDQIVRNKAYAFSRMHVYGDQGLDSYKQHFYNKYFATELEFLHDQLPESEFTEQFEEGYDTDLSNYLEALPAFYWNRLLNLADGGNRECPDVDHWTGQRLLELTPKLEERKKFDEVFIARTATIYTFFVYLGNLFVGEEQKASAWLANADEMLMEFYNVPSASKLTTNVDGLFEAIAKPIFAEKLTGDRLLSKIKGQKEI